MGSFEAVKAKAKSLKKEIRVLGLASKRHDTPLLPKVLIIIVVAYALSPIDLIPDFIPVLGYFDDLVLIPLGIWLALRIIPAHIIEECRLEAENSMGHEKPVCWTAGLMVIVVWFLIIFIILNKIVSWGWKLKVSAEG